ncbi:MAG TPA: PDZ domain-containing protein, partial [Trueperaceae bacterium]|nr:PDZ domain-containing protein [Trueperaceae bacterium]
MPKVVVSRAQPLPPRVTPARVSDVEPGSPAHRAGVRAGWELLTVNGEPIPDVLAYRRELAKGLATLRVREPE